MLPVLWVKIKNCEVCASHAQGRYSTQVTNECRPEQVSSAERRGLIILSAERRGLIILSAERRGLIILSAERRGLIMCSWLLKRGVERNYGRKGTACWKEGVQQYGSYDHMGHMGHMGNIGNIGNMGRMGNMGNMVHMGNMDDITYF